MARISRIFIGKHEPDVRAPILTNPTGTKTGETTATGTVVTDEANGTLCYYASTNTGETSATIIASGSSQDVTQAYTNQDVSFTELSGSTTYYAHYVHRDRAGNLSNVASAESSFTTDAGGAPTIWAGSLAMMGMGI